MMSSINAIGALSSTTQAKTLSSSQPSDPASGLNFQELLLNSLAETNQLDAAGQQAIEEFVSGGDVTQIEVMTAVKKADLSLRMMLQIRNKLLDAFNEIQNLRM